MLNCLHPVFAKRVGTNSSGRAILSFKGCTTPDYVLPCGKCEACRHNKRQSWCDRMALELFSRDSVGTFLTLTYNDKYNPGVLRKRDLQGFLKRLRNVGRDYSIALSDFAYFAVGEYGSLHKRPHYHLAFFGVDMMSFDWQPYIVGFDSHPIFASRIVERLWPFGFNVVGLLNSSSISYVSKYVSKSLKDGFFLRSLGLGRSLFVSATRCGRKWSYKEHSSFVKAFEDGYYCLPSNRGVCKVAFPHFLKERFRDLHPDIYNEFSEMRHVMMSKLSLDNKRPANARYLDSLNLADILKRSKLHECK